LRGDLLCELDQLFPIGQLAVQQQICDFFKTRLLRHFMNVVTAVHQPGIWIDPTDCCFASDDPRQTRTVSWCSFSAHLVLSTLTAI
jgi:hypothetical protein